MTAIKTPSSQAPSRETPSPETSAKPAARRERPNIGRHEPVHGSPVHGSPVKDSPVKGGPTIQHDAYTAPGAGAHAAHHLINDEATPGSGALPSAAHRAGKDVDGGAG